MQVFERMLDLLVPPAAFCFLLFCLPTIYFFRIAKRFLAFFFLKENVRGKVVLITGASSGIGEVNNY